MCASSCAKTRKVILAGLLRLHAFSDCAYFDPNCLVTVDVELAHDLAEVTLPIVNDDDDDDDSGITSYDRRYYNVKDAQTKIAKFDRESKIKIREAAACCGAVRTVGNLWTLCHRQ